MVVFLFEHSRVPRRCNKTAVIVAYPRATDEKKSEQSYASGPTALGDLDRRPKLDRLPLRLPKLYRLPLRSHPAQQRLIQTPSVPRWCEQATTKSHTRKRTYVHSLATPPDCARPPGTTVATNAACVRAYVRANVNGAKAPLVRIGAGGN